MKKDVNIIFLITCSIGVHFNIMLRKYVQQKEIFTWKNEIELLTM